MGATATKEGPARTQETAPGSASITRGASSEQRRRGRASDASSLKAEHDGKPKTGSAQEKQPAGRRNKDLGRKGEDAAARYLVQRGYEILERNWTCFAGEADIIARDEEWLVFVEVKTRKNTDKGFPSEAVNERKREKYERIALAYASEYSETEIPVRFDVVSIVVIGKDKAMIRHHMNAFTR